MAISYGGDNIAFQDGSTLASGRMGMVNRIINGRMEIDQRNSGASVTPVGGQYLVDRFVYSSSQASKFTAQQNAGSVTPPAGFTKYLGLTVASAVSIVAGDVFNIQQRIEGFNVADLAWGTANAKTVTLTFQVYSSLTGTFGGSLNNAAGNRSYPFTYSIPVANTWTPISITIAGDTTGTWLTDSGIGMYVIWGLGVGSTYSGTAGAWAGANYQSATGATSVVGTSGATFYITGVDLRPGTYTSAPTWEFRSYQQEDLLCKRYLPAFNSTSANGPIGTGYSYATTSAICNIPFIVTPRVAPTGISISNANHFMVTDTTTHTVTALVFDSATLSSGWINATTTGLTTNGASGTKFNSTSGQLLFTGCEL